MGECPECGHPVDVRAEDRQVLWDEYKHRHNLIWRVIFQLTTAIVVLSIVPYIAPDQVRCALGQWLLAAPAVALALVLVSMVVIVNELRLLKLITKAHRDQQRRVFQIPHRQGGLFDKLVIAYLMILLSLGAINLYVSAGHLPTISAC
jgi:uncharacterized membrane protein